VQRHEKRQKTNLNNSFRDFVSSWLRNKNKEFNHESTKTRKFYIVILPVRAFGGIFAF